MCNRCSFTLRTVINFYCQSNFPGIFEELLNISPARPCLDKCEIGPMSFDSVLNAYACNQMAPILYTLLGSPAARAVGIVANALNVTLEEREVDFLNEEHLKPAYLKINPLHTIPTLDDNGNIICDSHAINTYLIGKHAKDDSLYPTDIYKRALVDQKLAFNLGVLYPLLRHVDYAFIRKEIKALTPKMIEEIKNAYDFLEAFLKESHFIATNQVTLADIHCVTTATCFNYHLKIDPTTYPHTVNWMKRCLELPYFNLDAHRLKNFETFFDSLKK